MDEYTKALELIRKSRVARLHVGRVYNLGNYENQRVEITVEIGTGDDPARVLGVVEAILRDLYAKPGVSSYQHTRALERLANAETLKDTDPDALENARKTIERIETARAQRANARAMLATLEHTSEHTDAKEKWSDDDRDDDLFD